MKDSVCNTVRLVAATAVLVAATAHAQTWSQLNALPGTMEGMPLVSSNNPESVSR
jgi:hypothetical protein